MPPTVPREKVFLRWILFILVNFVFYFLIIFSTLGPCRTYDDSLLNEGGVFVTIVFFLAGLKFFKEIPKSKKVISIIIIIAAISFFAIVSRMNTSCSRGSDAAIKATLANLRATGELYKSANNSYAGFCNSKETDEALEFIYQKLLNKENRESSVVCYDNENAWAAISPLKIYGTAGGNFCVDSTGSGRESVSLHEGATSCP